MGRRPNRDNNIINMYVCFGNGPRILVDNNWVLFFNMGWQVVASAAAGLDAPPEHIEPSVPQPPRERVSVWP